MSISMKMRPQKIMINGKSIRLNDYSAFKTELDFLRKNQVAGIAAEKNVQKTSLPKTSLLTHNTYNVETSIRIKAVLMQTLTNLNLNPVESVGNIDFKYNKTEVSAFVAQDNSYTFSFSGNESAKSIQDCMKTVINCYGANLQQAVYDQISCRAESENLKLVEERVEKDKTVVLVYEM